MYSQENKPLSVPTRASNLAGWGNYPVSSCRTARPEKLTDIDNIISSVENAGGGLIGRGLGRSYGDAALNSNLTVDSTRLDHFIAFDKEHGIISAEAGVTLAEILEIAVPHGWILPVIPGTRYVTLGGAFACNVHGKNSYISGEFADHVLSVNIIKADGSRVTCSPEENSEIFLALAGGMGQGAFIESLTIRLRQVKSASLATQTKAVDGLDEMLNCFESTKDSSDYMVGWIDHTKKGHDLGRGLFEAAEHISEGDGGESISDFYFPKPRLNVPFFMPSFLLNKYTMAIYNNLRFRKYDNRWKEEIKSFREFFHPLDGIKNWYRLYGKKGFFQYQCLIPESNETKKHIRHILELIHSRNSFSSLAVIKYHREGNSMLSFSKRGYSLALDFHNNARICMLIGELNDYVAEIGGRVYLAKDALLTPEHFVRMYGSNLGNWRDVIKNIDPEGKFSSLMSVRLNMRGGNIG
ncbi:MAG: FAD-binding oxidoreductase [Rickettsiales bacterium]